MREIIDSMTRPYRERLEEGRASDAIGKIDLTIKAERSPKVVQLPPSTRSSGARWRPDPRRRRQGPRTSSSGKRRETPSRVSVR